MAASALRGAEPTRSLEASSRGFQEEEEEEEDSGAGPRVAGAWLMLTLSRRRVAVTPAVRGLYKPPLPCCPCQIVAVCSLIFTTHTHTHTHLSREPTH